MGCLSRMRAPAESPSRNEQVDSYSGSDNDSDSKEEVKKAALLGMIRRTRLRRIRTLRSQFTDFLRSGWNSRNLSGLAYHYNFPAFTF